MVDLKYIFEKRIQKVPKVRSISGVFITIDENLESTNYEPSYQRNYVWDDEKATYFIESIFIGTEVPPIILFKSEMPDGFINYEVIDGRQRYQSIIKFIRNELRLKKNGLQKLGDSEEFVGKTFLELSPEYQALFRDTKIRTIEYSIFGDYTIEEEEAVKREIFQRYNSGITPLKIFEIDRAKYHHNELNKSLKLLLEDECELDENVTKVFRWEKSNLDQKAIKLRELLVLHRIPIKYYASKKQQIISRYFEHLSSQLEDSDIDDIFDSFKRKIAFLRLIEQKFTDRQIPYNRLFAECVFWAISVVEQLNILCDLTDTDLLTRLVDYLINNKESYTPVRSSFYSVLVTRYDVTARFFEKEYSCNLRFAIDNNDEFKSSNQLLSKNEKTIKPLSFEEMRINKPEPTSVELSELLADLKSNRFLLRPSYQRADVKNKKKSSAIIESMLLGVMLPPIFVYKRLDGVSEVIDGQQRLLSIISFIGEQYKDENGVEQKPLLSKFHLDLNENAILKNLKGYSYSDLSKQDQNRIRKTSIYVIEIRADKNPHFDPVDLFVRLNNKPYPIACDSFEMWNSFAPIKITQKIKEAVRDNEKWFYFRKNNSRMDNENLYTTLIYFQYQYLKYGNVESDIVPEKTIEPYLVGNRISCRFRTRNEITRLLYSCSIEDLQDAMDAVEYCFVSNVFDLLDGLSKNTITLNKSMDELLRADNGKRTQMIFYILWILLHDISGDVVREYRNDMLKEITDIYKYTDECSNFDDFIEAVNAFRKKYVRDYCLKQSSVVAFCGVNKPNVHDSCFMLSKKPLINDHYEVTWVLPNQDDINCNHVLLCPKNENIIAEYVFAYLRSGLFYQIVQSCASKQIEDVLSIAPMPFVDLNTQEKIRNLSLYAEHSESVQKTYFERLQDVLFYELYYAGIFVANQIYVLKEISNFPELAKYNQSQWTGIIDGVYQDITNPTHVMSMYLLKVIDLEVLKSTK